MSDDRSTLAVDTPFDVTQALKAPMLAPAVGGAAARESTTSARCIGLREPIQMTAQSRRLQTTRTQCDLYRPQVQTTGVTTECLLQL
jgi:hypothetical protein